MTSSSPYMCENFGGGGGFENRWAAGFDLFYLGGFVLSLFVSAKADCVYAVKPAVDKAVWK